MDAANFIAGDWGTSHLRLFLCGSQGNVLDSRQGPGVAESGGRFAGVLSSLTSQWRERGGDLPTVLCGMVGSNIGWSQAPYVPCPAKPEQIAEACVALKNGAVHIVPGLSCRNPFGAPDFLRGEETQILGALKLVASLGKGRRLLCLPGTHTKWVVLEDGLILHFLSAPTGELFALLRDHSVLVRSQADLGAEIDSQAFDAGLVRFAEHPEAQLVHRLFECRARQLSGELTPHAARGFLSGLLVAGDADGALRALAGAGPAHSVHLIGTPDLTRLYAAALSRRGCDVREVDGAAASLAGLAQVHGWLSERVAANES
jgi:2-dehydro-3-deoxygalactonokinase